MKYIDILEDDKTTDNLFGLKQNIIDAVSKLPTNKLSSRILRRIQDQLSNNKVLDYISFYADKIKNITDNDKVITHNLELLSNIISAAAHSTTVTDRDLFFKNWEADTLINVDMIFSSKGITPLTSLIKNYGKSPMVTNVVNVLIKQESYGVGKGELMLAVLSKKIGKPKSKGDLLIAGKSIEIKTVSTSGPRFSDKQVKPAPNYLNFADSLIKKYSNELSKLPKRKSTRGVTINDWIKIGKIVENKQEYKNDTSMILNLLFPGMDNSQILAAIVSEKAELARDIYANHALDRYMNIKDDEGVLFLNLNSKEPTFIYFKNSKDLNDSGFKLYAETVYILYDNLNEVYPKSKIVSI